MSIGNCPTYTKHRSFEGDLAGDPVGLSAVLRRLTLKMQDVAASGLGCRKFRRSTETISAKLIARMTAGIENLSRLVLQVLNRLSDHCLDEF